MWIHEIVNLEEVLNVTSNVCESICKLNMLKWKLFSNPNVDRDEPEVRDSVYRDEN